MKFTIPLILAASASISDAFSPAALGPKNAVSSALFMKPPPVKDVKEEFKTSELNTMLQCKSFKHTVQPYFPV